METERHVRFFRNGSNQAIRIPREFEIDADSAIIRREDDRLVIKPVRTKGRNRLEGPCEADETSAPPPGWHAQIRRQVIFKIHGRGRLAPPVGG